MSRTIQLAGLSVATLDNVELKRLRDADILQALESIAAKANNEINGPNADDGRYQLFQTEVELDGDNDRCLVKQFRDGVSNVIATLDTARDAAKSRLEENKVAVDTFTKSWMNSAVVNIEGQYYTPSWSLSQLMFKALTTKRSKEFQKGEDRTNQKKFLQNQSKLLFEVLNNDHYASSVRRAGGDYWVCTTKEIIDVTDNKYTKPVLEVRTAGANKAAVFLDFAFSRNNLMVFDVPFPTKSNRESEIIVSNYIARLLGEFLDGQGNWYFSRRAM